MPGELAMRPSLFVSGIVFGALVIGTRAEAQNYPWCAHYNKGGGEISCSFSTWDQCMADVSGIGGFCQANNTYAPITVAPGSRHRARHKSAKNS